MTRKQLKNNKKIFDQKYGNYQKPVIKSEMIKNIYHQIMIIMKKHSSSLWKGNFTLADKYDRLFHARCLRIEELKQTIL